MTMHDIMRGAFALLAVGQALAIVAVARIGHVRGASAAGPVAAPLYAAAAAFPTGFALAAAGRLDASASVGLLAWTGVMMAALAFGCRVEGRSRTLPAPKAAIAADRMADA